MNSITRHLFVCGTAVAVALACCHPTTDPSKNSAAKSSAASVPQTRAIATPAAASSTTGPDMLSTVGLYDRSAVTSVTSREGRFALEKVDGVDTLTLNSKPVRYAPKGADTPQWVAANASISLVGVFELPKESVAWVTIMGGAACPGSHVLVGARGGHALPGQEIPGCDDRGTMRRSGDHITFEAGGSEGTYEDGLISVTSKPITNNEDTRATAM